MEIDTDGNIIPRQGTLMVGDDGRLIVSSTPTEPIRAYPLIVDVDDGASSYFPARHRGPLIIRMSIEDEEYPGRETVNRFNREHAPFIKLEVIEDGEEN